MLQKINEFIILIIATILISRLGGVFFGYGSFFTSILLIIIVIVIFFLFIKKKIKLTGAPIISYVALFIISILSLGYYINHDYSFSGNDNTGMAVMAKEYAKNNNIYMTDIFAQGGYSAFSNIREEGILPQFLPGYPSYLSFFYYYFGIEGIFLGNSLLLFGILLSFYILLGSITDDPYLKLFGVLFIGTNFLYIYFFQKTFSEILLMRGYLSSICLIRKYVIKNNLGYLLAGGFLASSLLFIKIEVILFLFPIVIGMKYYREEGEKKKIDLILGILCFCTPILGYYYFVKEFDHHYVITHLKPIYRYAGGALNFYLGIGISTIIVLVSNITLIIEGITNRLGIFKKILLNNKILAYMIIILIGIYLFNISGTGVMHFNEFVTIYIFQMFQNYNIGWFLLLLPALFIKKLSKNDVMIILLFLGACIFLINPGIGWRQPWAMRKFIVWMIPLLLFIYVITFRDTNKIIKYSISLLLLSMNLIYAFPILFTQEGKMAYDSMQRFESKYPGNKFTMAPGWSRQKKTGYYLNFFTTDIVVIRESEKKVIDPNNVYKRKKMTLGNENNYDFVFYEDHLDIPCNISGLVNDNAKNLPVDRIQNICRFIYPGKPSIGINTLYFKID